MNSIQILERLKQVKRMLRPCSLNESLGLTVIREISITIGRLGSLISLLENSSDNSHLSEFRINILLDTAAAVERNPCDTEAAFDLRLAVIAALEEIGRSLRYLTTDDAAATASVEFDVDIEDGVDEEQENQGYSSIDPEKPWPR